MNTFISNKPNPQHIQALVHCKQSELGHKLLEVIREASTRTKDALVSAEDQARIYRLQGMVRVLEELIEAVEISPDVLERLRK